MSANTEVGDVVSGSSYTSVFWEIEKFFSKPQDVGYEIRSDAFHAIDEEWYLIIYPNGKSRQFVGYVGLYLVKTNANPPIPDMKVKISVWMEKDAELIIISDKTDFKALDDNPHVGSTGTSFHAGVFIRRSQPVWQKAQCTPEASLIVFCEVIDPTIDEAKSIELPRKEVEKFREDFKEMFLSGRLSDFTVMVQGREFKCHRVVLAARSPVFAAMLMQEMQERATGMVEIEDCEPEAFQEFLIYLYSGSVDDFSVKNAFDLCRIADKYDTPQVKVKCVDMLTEGLSVENFCDIVKMALQYREAEMLLSAKIFFPANAEEIKLTESWQNFSKENPIAAKDFYEKS